MSVRAARKHRTRLANRRRLTAPRLDSMIVIVEPHRGVPVQLDPVTVASRLEAAKA